MSATPSQTGPMDRPWPRVDADGLAAFCRAALAGAGADEATVDAVTRAMMHGSLLGVDSHGVRLLGHYVRVLTEGRVNPRPKMRFERSVGAAAILEADHGHGALAAYTAVDHAGTLAVRYGLGAVTVRNGSHFGPAGAFALPAAEAGCIGIVTCNADSIVRLHDGAAPFHGTNPIACAAPVAGGRPWLFDMATSAIPYNRVELYRSTGCRLPAETASAADGTDTQDPAAAAMLAPLGGAFGFKGAGLAGLAEVLSAVLGGMRLSCELLPMIGPDFSTPRGLGAFVLVIDPVHFVGADAFRDGMRRYVDALRASPARSGAAVMAPGDREWAEADRRRRDGIPIDPATKETFEDLSRRLGIAAPRWRDG